MRANLLPEEAKQVRSKSAYKMHKRFYDFNIDLKIMESSNAKVKDFIHKIVSPTKKFWEDKQSKLFSRSAHTTEKSELKNLFKKRRSKNLNFENNVAEVLKKARLQKNLSQRALAKIINVPYQAIQRWEYGTLQPSLKHFLNLCKALDLEAKDFFF